MKYLYGVLMIVIVLLCVLVSSVNSAESLECYECNSNENEACSNGDAASLSPFKATCAQEKPYCRKIVQTVQKKTSIVRACGSGLGNRACYKTAGQNSANVCSCNSNLCNHAGIDLKQNRILTFISSIIFILVTMLLLR
ncbi:unnamed protein product [Didymodactylos carnosus]|uniref:Protein sleepless n=1 Tax=Didymodactylos carnosus TaxID=1234261 RepID=A0A813NWX1_9BILA|nr:unnamed protein product [Didymodactylos carnosus]CAF0784266.1 unnamed protein product [Didymodactylos carnosus]CAF3518293.1 unnamed protein product [Didymodactylos carnosus]CAF3566314.1 unnamed protein product [Didymodactylos carnosus]